MKWEQLSDSSRATILRFARASHLKHALDVFAEYPTKCGGDAEVQAAWQRAALSLDDFARLVSNKHETPMRLARHEADERRRVFGALSVAFGALGKAIESGARWSISAPTEPKREMCGRCRGSGRTVHEAKGEYQFTAVCVVCLGVGSVDSHDEATP